MNDKIYWKTKKVHLVMTVYNEENVIDSVIRDGYKFISKLPKGKFIITEDGSNDRTKLILNKYKNSKKIAIFMSNKRKGATQAFRDALKIASKDADLVLFSDSDGQHKIDDFYKLLQKSKRYDMVIGWKKHRNDPLVRIIGSKIWNIYLRILYGVKLHDINCGFRVMKKELLDKILPSSVLFDECVMTELTLRASKKGYKLAELPVNHFPRLDSKTRAWEGKKMVHIGLLLFSQAAKLRFL